MAKRKRRTFTPEFKGQVVLEALSGESSQAEVCHGIRATKLGLNLRKSGPNKG